MADTPLCRLDAEIIARYLPPIGEENRTDLQGAGAKTKNSSDKVVIDLGCGTGRLALPLAESGYRVVGVDLSFPMLANLKAKVDSELKKVDDAVQGESPGHRVHPLHANLVELQGLRDNVADHAVCMLSTLGMIQGRSNRRAVLAHAARMVRPGGQLILHVHRRWAALHEPAGWRRLVSSSLQSLASKEFEFGDSTYKYRGLSDMFMHRFSKQELIADLKCTGWEVRDLHLVALDGSRLLNGLRAGGFIVVADAK